MIKFKFFCDDNNDDTPDDGGDYVIASWMWITEEYMTEMFGNRFSVDIQQCRGIRQFLAQFIPSTIVKVKSITGPDGLIHNLDNEGTGWGFDITSDLITIAYFTIYDENV